MKQRGETVNDRLRADTFADCHEEVHWAQDGNHNDPALEGKQGPIHPTCNDINTDEITAEELGHAIKQFKRNEAPGPDGTTGVFYKWLGSHNRQFL